MSFRIKKHEPVAEAVRRMTRERLDESTGLLIACDIHNPEQCAKVVHKTRTNIKRLRALLRMIRPYLGTEVYHLENAVLRDAARQLASARDAAVLLETFDSLTQSTDAGQLLSDAPAVRETLVLAAGPGAVDTAMTPDIMRHVADQLRSVHDRIDNNWPLDGEGFSLIGKGLRTTYRSGVENMHIAMEYPDADPLHEWRKQVKYLWYGIHILESIYPDLLKPYGKSLEKLAVKLGEDHDLAILDQAILNLSTRGELPGNFFRKAIHDRRKFLQKEIFLIGRQVYADKPNAFVRRFKIWFDLWHRPRGKQKAVLRKSFLS